MPASPARQRTGGGGGAYDEDAKATAGAGGGGAGAGGGGGGGGGTTHAADAATASFDNQPRVNCPFCHKPLLTSVFHLHVGPCQHRHDERMAWELHRSLNMTDGERAAQAASDAAAAAAARAERDAELAVEQSVGGLAPGAIGTNGRIDRVEEGGVDYLRVVGRFNASVRGRTVVAVWRVTNRRLRARCVTTGVGVPASHTRV